MKTKSIYLPEDSVAALRKLAEKRERYSVDGREFDTLEAAAQWMAEHEDGDPIRTVRAVRILSTDEQCTLNALLLVERVKTSRRRERREQIRRLHGELLEIGEDCDELRVRIERADVGKEALIKRLDALGKLASEKRSELQAIEREVKAEFESRNAR